MSSETPTAPNPQKDKEQTTLFDRFKNAFLNHPFFAVVALIVVAVGALATFTESLGKLSDAWNKVSPALAPAWGFVYASLPALLAVVGLAAVAVALVGTFKTKHLSLAVSDVRERIVCAVVGIVTIAGSAGWALADPRSQETKNPQVAGAPFAIESEYSPAIQQCIKDQKPPYVIETATYITRVDHIGKERRESHRHLYTLRALRDFDNPLGQGFYDTFAVQGAKEAKWLTWRSGLIIEDTMPKSNYYKDSRIVPVSFAMKRGERRNIVLGADAIARLPLVGTDRLDDPIGETLPVTNYSRAVYDNVPPPGSGYTADCIGEVVLIVESASLSLKAATNALRLDGGRRVIVRNAVYTQNYDRSVLAASWTDVKPGDRLLFYYQW
jgi:hypothetical protein